MTEPKFTPGPWEFLEADDPNGEYNACRPLTISGGGDDLANIYSADDATVDITRDAAIANARLIAAAPDLLAALKLVRNWGRVEDLAQSEVASIDAAIAKAEGRA